MPEDSLMNVVRKDISTGQWFVQGQRIGKGKNHKSLPCPFCPSTMNKEEKIIARYPVHGDPWEILVLPDKYPIFQIEGEIGREGEGIYDKMNAIGAHEIVIETPNHEEKFVDFSIGRLENIIKMWQWRILDLKQDPRFRQILIFRNEGEAASLKHAHSQIIATPFVTNRINVELNRALERFQDKDRCLLCDIKKEEQGGSRAIDENNRYLAITPFASRFPYEVWILPKLHLHAFERDNSEESINYLAKMIKSVTKRLENVLLDEVSYILCLHTAPNKNSGAFKDDQWKTLEKDFHWHIEIMPKTSKSLGIERALGIYINPITSEEAAEQLRKAI